MILSKDISSCCILRRKFGRHFPWYTLLLDKGIAHLSSSIKQYRIVAIIEKSNLGDRIIFFWMLKICHLCTDAYF